jgi:serine protease AprX
VGVLDRVIVAEMQGGGDDLSAISRAADAAFDAGAVVIAANGNNGPSASTVNTPANAHRVIGVGNFDVQTQNQVTSQSRGPAPDGRFKPDIQAPTNTETASNAFDTAFRSFGGTSGATPYAAGAAALLRNWLRGSSFSIDRARSTPN